MAAPAFFSRSASLVVGVTLLVILVWAVFMLGPTAFDRWFG